MKHCYTPFSDTSSLKYKTQPSERVIRNILDYSLTISLLRTTTGIISTSQWGKA